MDRTKTTSIIASKVSIFTTTFNTNKHHGFLECEDLWWHPPSSTNLFGTFSIRPSVRQANNFMFLSIVDTPLGGPKIPPFFFLSFMYCCTAGYTTFGLGTRPTNVAKKSLVMNEVRSFPEGDKTTSLVRSGA